MKAIRKSLFIFPFYIILLSIASQAQQTEIIPLAPSLVQTMPGSSWGVKVGLVTSEIRNEELRKIIHPATGYCLRFFWTPALDFYSRISRYYMMNIEMGYSKRGFKETIKGDCFDFCWQNKVRFAPNQAFNPYILLGINTYAGVNSKKNNSISDYIESAVEKLGLGPTFYNFGGGGFSLGAGLDIGYSRQKNYETRIGCEYRYTWKLYVSALDYKYKPAENFNELLIKVFLF